jgi:hypothetical protein
MLPLISGPPLPKPPRDPPQPEDAQWIKVADTWASFVLVYLEPWDLERGIPPRPLSWRGLEEWCAAMDRPSALHRGRWQLARNMATAAMNDSAAKNVAFRYRRRTAHTYAQYEAMRQDPHVRAEMDAAEAQRFQAGVDPESRGIGGGPVQQDDPREEAAQRVIDLLQERFARYADGQVPNRVAIQRQRDEQTVENLARILAPDVSAPNAFDDLSGPSSQSSEDDQHGPRDPEDCRLPLDSTVVRRLAARSTTEEMQSHYTKAKRARPRALDEPIEAPVDHARFLPSPVPPGEDLDGLPTPIAALSADQRATFDRIMAKYTRGEQLLEIVHGMPGTGKTVRHTPFSHYLRL